MANQSLKGVITVPGDKSISHRSIILGAISKGNTHITNFLKSNDCLSTMNAFRQLGIRIEQSDKEVIVHGQGIQGLSCSSKSLDMGNSGTTTRLISGLLAGQPFISKLFGDASLSKRPMKRIIDPLTQMGASIDSKNNTLPLTINGNQLHGISYRLPIASAQVKSSIILAALQANSDTTIIEPVRSRNHTEQMLRTFSPKSITQTKQKIVIHPHQPITAQNVHVPGDISSAAFFLVAGAIVPNSEITIKHVGINPTRTGIINVLKRMEAKLTVTPIGDNAEPLADIKIEAGPLKPFTVTEEEIPGLVDEVPLLALLAACADGISKITGAEELRFKESDRLSVVTTEFKKLGIKITELKNGFVIDGRAKWHLVNANLDSHQDHRIAMTLKIASLLLDEDVKIKNFDAIKISYPNFTNDLNKLRS